LGEDDEVMAMHADELTVDEAIVRRLVDDQFPRWRRLPVQRLATAATVNAIFRIGDDLTARFPLRGEDPVKVRARLRA
jgi:aminoglycoside phosphotransferase (APT) family kinase protein